MEPPAITRQRRPFLAPIWLTALLGLLAVGMAFAAYRKATTTTVVITRHAEKVLGSIEDSPLTPQGELRAQALARMFGGNAGGRSLDAIYVTDTRRARQTAAPLAERLRREPIVVPGRDVADLAARIVREHRGRAVLVVGHSNTIPELIRRLSGEDVAPIADDEYDNLYIVSVPTFGDANVLQMKY